MAKYDENGKQIYETADEYNEAHKKEDDSRTYNSPEGDAYEHNPEKNISLNETKENGVKTGIKSLNPEMIKLIIVIALIAFCIVGVIIAFFVIKNGVKKDTPAQSVVETEAETEFELEIIEIETEEGFFEEYLGDDSTPLPEGFEAFSYNGQAYSLPITVKEIKNMGLVIESEYEEGSMIPAEFEEILFLNDENGMWMGMIRVSNTSEEEKVLEECSVNFFYIVNSVMYDEAETVPDFVCGNGLSFASTYDDFVSYLGTPYYHYADYSDEENIYDSYEWTYYGETEYHNVSATFYNGEISEISIEKIVEEE